MIEAYPLHWPIGYKRKEPYQRKNSQFTQTMDKAQRFLRAEVDRLGGKDLIVSSNVPVRKDGGLYSDWMNRRIEDPGVAIYFTYKGKQISMCCDQYVRVWENVYALGKGIEALRGMSRWGVSEFLDRAFTGFKALPETTMSEDAIWNELGLSSKPNSFTELKTAYRERVAVVHPDKPTGSAEAFHRLQQAYTIALKFFEPSTV